MASRTRVHRTSLIPRVSVPEGTRGPWRIEHFSIRPGGMNIERLRLAMAGRAPGEGDFTRLVHERHGLVMSDTDAEVRDHYEFVLRARGDVLITGLGLGMCLGAALRREQVRSVTVVEIDQDLIDLVGPHYRSRRVQIVCADAYTWRPPVGARYGAIWHDIWAAPDWESTLPQMATLQRRYGRHRAPDGWQGCWMRHDLVRDRRESRQWDRIYRA